MDKLKPCPFCGEENDFGIGRGTEDREGFPTYIYCGACGAQGPWVYTREKLAFTNTQFCAQLTMWEVRPADALLSDLAEVEVPEDPYEGDGEPDDDLDAVARADKWYNDCKKLCVTMRPLIERAKKVRG